MSNSLALWHELLTKAAHDFSDVYVWLVSMLSLPVRLAVKLCTTARLIAVQCNSRPGSIAIA